MGQPERWSQETLPIGRARLKGTESPGLPPVAGPKLASQRVCPLSPLLLNLCLWLLVCLEPVALKNCHQSWLQISCAFGRQQRPCLQSEALHHTHCFYLLSFTKAIKAGLAQLTSAHLSQHACACICAGKLICSQSIPACSLGCVHCCILVKRPLEC